MKTKKTLFYYCFLALLVACLTSACSNQRMIEYYTEPSNYIHASGTIHHIQYDTKTNELYLGISEQEPKFDDTNFVLDCQSSRMLQESGFIEKLQIGDRISFVAAPRYWGDGYAIPIVSVEHHGETLLDFEVGYANLLDSLH